MKPYKAKKNELNIKHLNNPQDNKYTQALKAMKIPFHLDPFFEDTGVIKYRLYNSCDIGRVYFSIKEINKVLEEYIWRIKLYIQEYNPSEKYPTHSFSLLYKQRA